MMHIRKLIAASSVFALLAMTLTGYSAASAAQRVEKPKTLELWVPPTISGTDPVQFWKDALLPWEQANQVKVNTTITSWAAYEAKMLLGISSDAGPDVAYMYNEMVGDYIDRGQLLPLGQYLSTRDKLNYKYLDKGKVNGKQYMMPFIVGGARVLYYNKDVLSKSGVTTAPTTWTEFSDAAKKIKAAGYTPFIQQWGDPNKGAMNAIFYPFLYQAGGSLFNKKGTATAFNSTAGLKAAKFILQMKTDGLMPNTVNGLDLAQANTQFRSGKVGFMVGPDAHLPAHRSAGVDVGIVYSLQDRQQGTFVAVDSLVVPKGCKVPKLCVSLINFIESGKVMEQIHKYAPYNPIGNDQTYGGQPEFSALYAKPTFLRQLPVVSGSTQVYDLLYKNLQKMLLGQMTPEQALSDAARAGDAVIGTK
jgi:multiple sugar transport system substrate-binding protein